MKALTLSLLTAFLVLGCSEPLTGLSLQDRSTITNVIAKENIGNITAIQPMRDGTVRVHTQIPGEEGGKLLTVAKTKMEWKVLERGVWMH